jgi:hypothetical protein
LTALFLLRFKINRIYSFIGENVIARRRFLPKNSWPIPHWARTGSIVVQKEFF